MTARKDERHCNTRTCMYVRNLHLQTQCRSLYTRVLARGKLKPPSRCPFCSRAETGHKAIGGHHYDYGKYLDVVWCCNSCHQKLHVLDRHRIHSVEALKIVRSLGRKTSINFKDSLRKTAVYAALEETGQAHLLTPHDTPLAEGFVWCAEEILSTPVIAVSYARCPPGSMLHN